MTYFLALATFTSAAVGMYAVTRIPTLWGTSLVRQRMWDLRDQIATDRRHGVFPEGDEGVVRLLESVDAGIELSRSLTFRQLRSFGRAIEQSGRTVRAPHIELQQPATLEAMERFEAYRHRVNFISTAGLLVTSWSGLLELARLLLRSRTFRMRLSAAIARDPGMRLETKITETLLAEGPNYRHPLPV